MNTFLQQRIVDMGFLDFTGASGGAFSFDGVQPKVTKVVKVSASAHDGDLPI